MPLLQHYLRAVRLYLPKGAQQDDIIEEIAGHLTATIEEEESRLGRPLTEVEEEALLTRHGGPMVVAERYGVAQRGLAFGRQLISPETFPLYARLLTFQLPFTLAVLVFIGLTNKSQLLTPSGLVWPLLIQFCITTGVFMMIDLFQRRSRRSGVYPSGWVWNFPPPHLQPIPRWQSAAAMAVFAVAGLWWAALPYQPSLVIGRAAGYLELTSAWEPFYWPVLAVIGVGIAQRSATWLRPDWNWLQPPTRVLTNAVVLVLVYLFLKGYPFLAVRAGSTVATAAFDATRLSDNIWWHTGGSFGLYALCCLVFNAFLCVQILRRHARRRLEQPA